MADTSNLSSYLTDIADAIRAKKETTAEIPAENFDTEILSIETGIDTSDATATVNDIIAPKTAYIAGSKQTGTIQPVYGEGDGSYEVIDIDDMQTYTSSTHYTISMDGTLILDGRDGSGKVYVLDNKTNKFIKKSSTIPTNTYFTNAFISAAGFDNDNNKYLMFRVGNSYNTPCYIYIYDKEKDTITTISGPTYTTSRLGMDDNCVNPTFLTGYSNAGESSLEFLNLVKSGDTYTIVKKVITNATSGHITKPDGTTTNIGNSFRFINSSLLWNDMCTYASYSANNTSVWKYCCSTKVIKLDSAYGSTVKYQYVINERLNPNPSLTYCITDDNKIKKFFFNEDTGEYTITDLETDILLTNSNTGMRCVWLDDETIALTEYQSLSVKVYHFDAATNLITKLYEFSIEGVSDIDLGIIVRGRNLVVRRKWTSSLANVLYFNETEKPLIGFERQRKNYTDISTSNFNASDLIKGKVAFNQNGKVIGTLVLPLTQDEYNSCVDLTEQIYGTSDMPYEKLDGAHIGYTNINWSVTTNTKIELTVTFDDLSTFVDWNNLFACRDGLSRSCLLEYDKSQDAWLYCYNGAILNAISDNPYYISTTRIGLPLNEKINFKVDAGSLYTNDSLAFSYTGTYTMEKGSFVYMETDDNKNCVTFHSLKIWEQGFLVREMYPVNTGTEIRMYDMITKMLY